MGTLVAVLALLVQDGARISTQEETEHRVAGEHFIRAANPGFFRTVSVQVSVNRAGAVTRARATDGPKEFRRDAMALAKTWTYKPFRENGHAVPATLTSLVWLLPMERAPCGQEPFPVIRDMKSIDIRLKRTRCFGSCPAYEIQIDGGGGVEFKEEFPVHAVRHSVVPEERLMELIDRFRNADYFSLCPSYVWRATDLPTYTTSISIDGKTMSIVDYGGLQVGMPVGVQEIEDAIDKVAGAGKWLAPKTAAKLP